MAQDKKSSVGTVREIQELLISNGYRIRADGKYGPKTQSAIKDFQSKHKLKIDGLVGPITWANLNAWKDQKLAPVEPLKKVWFAPGSFKASPFAYEWARTFEVFEALPYNDMGKPAQGYGHNAGSGIHPIPDWDSPAWSKEYAEQVLVIDMKDKVHYLNAWVTAPLEQHQIDALALDIFQQGAGNFRRGPVLAALNAKKYEEVPDLIRNRPTTLGGLKRRFKVLGDMFEGKHPNIKSW